MPVYNPSYPDYVLHLYDIYEGGVIFDSSTPSQCRILIDHVPCTIFNGIDNYMVVDGYYGTEVYEEGIFDISFNIYIYDAIDQPIMGTDVIPRSCAVTDGSGFGLIYKDGNVVLFSKIMKDNEDFFPWDELSLPMSNGIWYTVSAIGDGNTIRLSTKDNNNVYHETSTVFTKYTVSDNINIEPIHIGTIVGTGSYLKAKISKCVMDGGFDYRCEEGEGVNRGDSIFWYDSSPVGNHTYMRGTTTNGMWAYSHTSISDNLLSGFTAYSSIRVPFKSDGTELDITPPSGYVKTGYWEGNTLVSDSGLIYRMSDYSIIDLVEITQVAELSGYVGYQGLLNNHPEYDGSGNGVITPFVPIELAEAELYFDDNNWKMVALGDTWINTTESKFPPKTNWSTSTINGFSPPVLVYDSWWIVNGSFVGRRSSEILNRPNNTDHQLDAREELGNFDDTHITRIAIYSQSKQIPNAIWDNSIELTKSEADARIAELSAQGIWD